MFKKVATKPAVVSAEQAFVKYARNFVEKNPTYKLKGYNRYMTDGTILAPDGKIHVDYGRFKEILAACNHEIADKLINGFTYDLGHGLGDLFVGRIIRPPNHNKLDIRASLNLRKKLEAEGKLTEENWKIPYTDDEFIMLVWHKGNGKATRNGTHIYKFKTAGGAVGKSFRSKLSQANKHNLLLKSFYPVLPSKTLN